MALYFLWIRRNSPKPILKVNEAAFWDYFTSIYGKESLNDLPYFDEFYRNEFQNVKKICGFEKKAADIVRSLKSKGIRVILATNPIFPSIATESRIRWAGLVPEDFELYTTYENIGYCKPNLDYYREICSRLGLNPQNCLMVRNDVGDDMVVTSLGMQTFLLTDCLINKANTDINIYPHDSFTELESYLNTLIF